MADEFGLSFSPLNPPPGQAGGPNGYQPGGGSGSPIQDAVRILSLRIPRVVGASALGPSPLLNGPGGAGFGGGGSLEALLMRIFGRRPGSGPVAAMPMPSDSPFGTSGPDMPGAKPPYPSLIFSPPGGTPPTGPTGSQGSPNARVGPGPGGEFSSDLFGTGRKI